MSQVSGEYSGLYGSYNSNRTQFKVYKKDGTQDEAYMGDDEKDSKESSHYDEDDFNFPAQPASIPKALRPLLEPLSFSAPSIIPSKRDDTMRSRTRRGYRFEKGTPTDDVKPFPCALHQSQHYLSRFTELFDDGEEPLSSPTLPVASSISLNSSEMRYINSEIKRINVPSRTSTHPLTSLNLLIHTSDLLSSSSSAEASTSASQPLTDSWTTDVKPHIADWIDHQPDFEGHAELPRIVSYQLTVDELIADIERSSLYEQPISMYGSNSDYKGSVAFGEPLQRMAGRQHLTDAQQLYDKLLENQRLKNSKSLKGVMTRVKKAGNRAMCKSLGFVDMVVGAGRSKTQ